MYWVISSFLVFILAVLIFYKIKFKKIVSEIETAKSNIYLCDNRINDIRFGDVSIDLSEEALKDDLVGKLKMLAITDSELRELFALRNPAHIPHLIEYIMTKPEPARLAFVAKEREKITMDKIRQKIAELNRYIKNKRIANYNTNLNNRMKLNKIKDGGLYTTANTKNLNYISENKNNFDAKKKLCLSNSFLIRPKSKITDKNNKKKLFFKN